MKWKKAMSGAYQLACEKAAKIYTSGKNNIAGKRKVWCLCLAICASKKYIKERGGPGELRSYWEVVIYQVVHQTSYETSVFKIIPKFREGKTITLHRSMFSTFSRRGKTQHDITPISPSKKTKSKMKQKPNEEHRETKLSKLCVRRNTRKYNLRRARSTTM